MAKRYYLSPVAGPNAKGTYYPLVKDLITLGAGEGFVVSGIPTDANGVPTINWCLVAVNVANHLPILADTRIDPLPDFPLDGKVNAIQQLTKTKMIAALTRRGIDTTFIQNADGFREIIRTLGQKTEPAFDENNFDTL